MLLPMAFVALSLSREESFEFLLVDVTETSFRDVDFVSVSIVALLCTV